MTTVTVSESAGSLVTEFTTLATIDGTYDVIDGTGRTVANREDRPSANGLAYMLNRASKKGPEALSKLLVMGRAKWYGDTLDLEDLYHEGSYHQSPLD